MQAEPVPSLRHHPQFAALEGTQSRRAEGLSIIPMRRPDRLALFRIVVQSADGILHPIDVVTHAFQADVPPLIRRRISKPLDIVFQFVDARSRVLQLRPLSIPGAHALQLCLHDVHSRSQASDESVSS